MHYQREHISVEILSAHSPAGDLCTLVSFDDGNIGITRNGEPLPVHWPMTDEGMKESTEYFLRLTEVR